ncbi:hypothetical protein GCM10008904_13190 [Paraclostridium ghonii]|uniref:Sensor histidine kinase NatK-like C-terminal domain-containing protein n=1 Tax=Paraclostridium ghonii TaxID=29358 RepID=A0ABU0N3Q0_9FIRM|nr:GHKL domain-containing protein [Paeniclostridium ghonii]MDQ0557589.1 hypothetical protein [Paeniclostridium ghonii]
MIIPKIRMIEITTFLFIYLYNVFLINMYGKVSKFKVNKKKSILFFPLIITIISTNMIIGRVFLHYIYIINFFVYIITFKLVFEETIGGIYILSICQIFLSIINSDIITAIIAVMSRNNMYKTVENYYFYILIFILSKIIIVILLIKFDKEYFNNNLKKLLLYKKKIVITTLTITSLVIILLASNYIYYYVDIDTPILRVIVNRKFIYVCFFCAIAMGFKSIKWIEEEVLYKAKLLNLNHDDTINKKNDEYLNLLKMYNHDFKSILINVKTSIEIGNIEKAKEIISEFDNQIQSVINHNKKFSNNSIINAILNKLYEECNIKNICFDSDCYIPNELSISELELIKIFNNLSSNAFEACIKQEISEEKWINFRSYVKENNLIIYQSNSFNGEINFRNERLITTKENSKNHGIGVEIIKHIVDGVKGISLIKVDPDRNEFKFLIKIPLSIK